MPTTKRVDSDAIQQLRYIDPVTGRGSENSPPGVPVTDFGIFHQAVSFTEDQYNAFVASIVGSLVEIADDDTRDIAAKVLQTTLDEVQAARSYAYRLRWMPGSGAYVASGQSSKLGKLVDKELNALMYNGGTSIGPVVLPPDVPVTDVAVSEEYDVEILRTLRGVSDPVFRGQRNKPILTLTLKFPPHTVNTVFRRLLATLRVAPVVEIESDAIVPIFMNSLLTPELVKQIREVASAKISTLPEAKDAIQSVLKFDSSKYSKPKAPQGIPNLGSLTTYTVTSVYDGDTIYVSPSIGGQNAIRVDGINTPEVYNENTGSPAQPGGVQAKAYLTQLLAGSGNQVKFEPSVNPFDKFGRALGYLYLSDGTQVNLKMIQEGHARPFPIEPNTKYRSAYREAYLANAYPKYDNFKAMLREASPIADFLMREQHPELLPPPGSESGGPLSTASPIQKTLPRVSIAAAFAGYLVQTDQQDINTLVVKLSFVKFNDAIFHGEKLLYRDKVGNPTTNVFDCPWIDKLAEFSFLNPARRDAPDSVHFMEQFTIPPAGQAVISFGWEDPISGEDQEYVPLPGAVVVEDVAVQGSMKMVTIPLAGQVHPVCQYLGADNMVATVSMKFMNRLELARFHEMKAEVDRTNYDITPGDRRSFLRVSNNVLNLLGARTFVIERIDSSLDTGGNCHTVSMRLIESRLSPDQVETVSLVVKDREVVSDLKMAWEYMYSVLFEGKHQEDLEEVERLVYGKEGKGGLLSPNAIAATYYRLMWKATHGKDANPWDTSEDNDKMIAGFMREEINPLLFSLPPAATPRFDPRRGGPANDDLNPFFDPHEGYRKLSRFAIIFALPGAKVDDAGYEGLVNFLALWPAPKRTFLGNRDTTATLGSDLLSLLSSYNRRAADQKSRIALRKDFWNAYFDVVMFSGSHDRNPDPYWNEDDLSIARVLLGGLVSRQFAYNLKGIPKENFKSLFIMNREEMVPVSLSQANQRSSNYADIRLPTYAQLFGKDSVVDSGSGRSVPLWKRFAPTYGDLGKIPPYDMVILSATPEEASGMVARSINDEVEPDLPYHHERIRPLLKPPADSEAAIEASLNYFKQNAVRVDTSEIIRSGGTLADYLSQILRGPAAVSTEQQEDKRRLRESLVAVQEGRKHALFITSDGRTGHIYTKNNVGDSAQVNLKTMGALKVFPMDSDTSLYEVVDQKPIMARLNSYMDRFWDRERSLINLFPVCRLYFVESDGEQAYLADDLYGSNCVLSLNVRRDKEDAAVLEAQLSNVTDNLGTESVLDKAAMERLGIPNDDAGEPFFSKLKLQAGVGVQVRAGYGTKADDLQIIFTGVITEIEPGKVLSLVAQGYKRELLNPVDYAKKNVTFPEVIQDLLLTYDTPHLGEILAGRFISDRRIQKAIGDGLNKDLVYGPWRRFSVGMVSSATRNMFLQTEESAGGKAGCPILSNPQWVVSQQSVWDSLQEITRYLPGHVVDVVPQGSDATIFLGVPNQPYQAEEPSPGDAYVYDKIVRQLTSFAVEDIINETLAGFIPGSDEWKEYRLVVSLLSGPFTGAYDKNYGMIRYGFYDPSVVSKRDIRAKIDGDWSADIEYVDQIDPDLYYQLFCWFFEIDPARGRQTSLPSGLEATKPVFGNWGDQESQDVLSALSSGQLLAVQMSLVQRKNENILTFRNGNPVYSRDTSAIREYLGARVKRGMITLAEMESALSVFESQAARDAPLTHRGTNDPSAPPETFSSGDTVGSEFFRRGRAFKLFVHYLSNNLRARHAKGEESAIALSKSRIHNARDRFRFSSLPPGWKEFRDYHYVSFRDIIQNDITASNEEMANCVLVRAPRNASWFSRGGVEVSEEKNSEGQTAVTIQHENTDWISYPTNDGMAFNEKIGLKNRKLLVVVEPNAVDKDKKSRALVSNMGNALRPMYRGTLTIRGRAMKPHDVIYLADDDKDVRGLFEVASVTHQFSSATGWITTIEPHALVELNNPTSRIQISAWLDIISSLDTAMSWIETGAFVAMVIGAFVTTGPGGGVVAAAEASAGKATTAAARKGILAGMRRLVAGAGTKFVRKFGLGLFRSGGEAAGGRATGSILRSLGAHFINNSGRYAFLSTAANHGGTRIAKILTAISVRNQLRNTELPITVHLLQYQFQPFQAGLEVEEDDIYGLDDRLGSTWLKLRIAGSDMARKLYEFVTSPIQSGTHPLDRLEDNK